MKVIKYVFTIIGAGMLIGAYFLYKSTSTFLEDAVSTEGTVIELLRVYSDSDSGTSITYKPVVEFLDKNGSDFEFTSSSSSNPPSYSIGEKVEVLYNPTSPNKAKIKGFFSLWGAATIVGGLGTVFFLIGGAILIFSRNKKKLKEHLKLEGKRIEADIQSVGLNTSYAVNGRNPFQIIAQWQNPSTSKLHIFKSDNLWFDPSDFLKEETITVLIDKRNPNKYWVDTSFLPEVAK